MKNKIVNNKVEVRRLCPYVYSGDCTEHFANWSQVIQHLQKDHGEQTHVEAKAFPI